MGKRKDIKIRKLRSLGGCSCVTLPFDAVKKFGWVEDQELEVAVNYEAKEIIVRSHKK